ncbi:MAG: LamG-like jellyroll fold domain-containing protein [Muribaculaceae bacterium]
MKKIFLLFAFAIGVLSIANAQYLNTGDIEVGAGNDDFRISSWEATADENFYISRVKPKERFYDAKTQTTSLKPWWQWTSDASDATNGLNYSKKLLLWVPVNTKTNFGVLPNGIYGSEVFSMWQYVSTFGLWTEAFMRVPGNFADVAHKNGVSVVTNVTTGWNVSLGNSGTTIDSGKNSEGVTYTTKWGQTFIDLGSSDNRSKTIAYLESHGIDGIGYNSEWQNKSTSTPVISILNLNKDLATSVAKKNYTTFSAENIWYDGTREDGGPSFDHGVTSSTDEFFGTEESKLSSFFYNYNWNRNNFASSDYLNTSISYIINTSKRNPYDGYAGFNLQGGEPQLTGSGATNGRWQYLDDKAASIGLWSGHDTNAFWENRNALGSEVQVSQDTYQKTLERWFTNSNYNPSTTDDETLVVNESLSRDLNEVFFGMSKLVEAQSVLSWDLTNEPFVTFFNVGNGKYFNWKGKRQHSNEWYNIGVQDYLPTWRWWWSKELLGTGVGNVPSGMSAAISWNDAWFGGSSMRVTGTNDGTSYLHLFKTAYSLKKDDVITIRYKVNSGSTNCSLVLGTSAKIGGDVSNSTYEVVDATTVVYATWIEQKIILTEDINNLAVIALKFDNVASLDMNFGELSIKRGEYSTPDVPSVTSSSLLRFNMYGVDGKVIFDMNKTEGNKTGDYNIDHNAMMYNIYAEITYTDGSKTKTLMGSTTSWAGVFFSAPLDQSKVNDAQSIKIGVAAVALDGETESDIVWGDSIKLDYDTNYKISDDIEITNSYVTDGEVVTIRFADYRHSEAKSWKIIGPVSNADGVASTETEVATNTTGFTATADIGSKKVSLDNLPYGIYDVVVTYVNVNGDEVTETLPAYLSIYSSSVGNPHITKLVAIDTDGDDKSAISPVSAEVANSVLLKNFKWNQFLWGDSGEPIQNDGWETLPGAGIKIKGGQKLTMAYELNSNSVGAQSRGVQLEYKALGVKAKDIGLSGNTFSVAFWMKINEIGAASWLLNIRGPEKTTWSQNTWGWLWSSLNTSGEFTQVVIRGSSEAKYNYNNVKFLKGAWYHVAFVFNNGALTLYVNGNSIATSSVENTGSANTLTTMSEDYTIAIGGNGGKGDYAGFDGVIDNFQIYNSALTSEEVANSMKQIDDPSKVNNLIGFWDFENEITGSSGGTESSSETVETGFANRCSGSYSSALLKSYNYPGVQDDNANYYKTVEVPVEAVGSPMLNGSVYSVSSKKEFLMAGMKDAAIVSTSVTGIPVRGDVDVFPEVQTMAETSDGTSGYVEFSFPEIPNNVYKIYKVKMTVDNGIGTDEADYQYVYVVNMDNPIYTDVRDVERGDFRIVNLSDGVEMISETPVNVVLCNVMGQVIRKFSLNGVEHINLPKGVYIANDHKFVVR